MEVDMRTPLRTVIAIGAIMLGVGVGSARAAELAVVTVPFPFVVNGHTLPAGKYEVRSNDEQQFSLLITGMNGNHARQFVLTNAEYGRDPAGSKPALTFVRRENQYLLKEVWESPEYAREVPVR
jgi:hypothetical protein